MTARLLRDDVTSVAAALSARYPDIAREKLDALVAEVYQELAADARLTTHLSALTLNRCRKRLANQDVG